MLDSGTPVQIIDTRPKHYSTRAQEIMAGAVQRTFLARDGSGKAPVEPERMMLGPCRGGVARLGNPGEVLLVGEGIETCLAANAGHWPSGMGSAFDLRPKEPRASARSGPRDCGCRWR